MRFLLILFMLLPTGLWANELVEPCPEALVADQSLSENYVTSEVLKFLAFLHPMQTEELLVKVRSFEAIFYLVHWSSGFRYPTSPIAYARETESYHNSVPFQNLFSFSTLQFLARPEFADQFAHHVPVLAISHRKQVDEIRRFFARMRVDYQKSTADGVWPLLDPEIRQQLATAMLDGFFSVVPEFSRASKTHHTAIPGGAEREVRGALNPSQLEHLQKLKQSLERPKVLALVLRAIINCYPQLLARRFDFRVKIGNYDTHEDEKGLNVYRGMRPEQDLLRVKSYLLRPTKRSENLGSFIKTAFVDKPPQLTTRESPVLHDFSDVREAIRLFADRRETMKTEDAEDFIRFFDQEMPAVLSTLSVRSRLDLAILNNLDEVSAARATLLAEQDHLEMFIEILELNDLVLDVVRPLLRAGANDLPDSALSHARLKVSLRRVTLLRFEEMRPSLSLLRTAAEARYRLNVIQLQNINQREKILLDGIVEKASAE